jgi:hypothetical protein
MRVFDFEGGGPYDACSFQRAFERNTYFNFVAHR